jgi:hypothetical protein
MHMFSTEFSSLGAQLQRRLRKTAIAAVIGAGLMVAASSSFAVVVYSGPVNLPIATTTNGLYLNVLNGAINEPGNTGGATVAGWDINLWSSSGLGFFNPAAPAGGVYVITSPGFVGNLATGTTIGGGSSFGSGSSAAANAAQWNLNSDDNLFGFRFLNEGGGTVHYGWARFSLGGSVTDPSRALVEYAFESTPGLAIQAGVVPEPGTYALMGLGIAGVLLAARRRRQA